MRFPAASVSGICKEDTSMKRILSLVLALVMVLGCVPAYAAAKLPAQIVGNMSELTGVPAEPTAPEYTLETADGHYVLTIADGEKYAQNGGIFADSRNDEWDWSSVYFEWDEDKKAFVSNDLLDIENYPEDPTLYFNQYGDQTWTSVQLDFNTGAPIYSRIDYEGENGNTEYCYVWNQAYDEFYFDNQEGAVFYDTTDGSLSSYRVTTEDYDISYDPYGRISWVSAAVETDDGYVYADWDEIKKAWVAWDFDAQKYVAVETDLPAFDASKHPALIALPYVIDTPPASFVSGGEGFVSDDGNDYYTGENLRVFYNDNGAIDSYTISTFEGYEISYDRYGRMNWVSTYDNEGWILDWNETTQQWEKYDRETDTYRPVTGLDPFVASKFPAPYAEPYTVTLPPATLTAAKIDTAKFVADELGEMKLGEDGIVSLADVDYFNASINYRDANGNYKYVSMVYDETTKTWISDAALPAGVALTDLNVNLIDENWKYTTYRKGALDSISIDNVVKEADGTYIRYDYENEYNVTAYYDAAGNMSSYRYNNFEQTMGVEYDMNGNLLYAWADAADGKTYYYYDASDPLKLDDGTTISGWYYWDENDKRVLCNEPAGLELPEALINAKPKKADVIWYPENTMCVAGISLKDTYGITDKWYNVVPVDLTKDGTQTFDLVASGMFLIGKANVTVADGNVTVTYGMPWGHGYIKEEVLNWFTSVDQITAEFCEAPTSAYAFGEPVSISEDLGGADVGLLFICNRVTYRQPYYNSGAHLVRWYCNKPEWKAFREQLMTIMPE